MTGISDKHLAVRDSILERMFRDRRDAGEQLVGPLMDYRGRAQTLVLALPRGGVPVAAVLACKLSLPLDILSVHKLGAPQQPELAIGAVASDGLMVLDTQAVASMQISESMLDSILAREREELLRRERLYRGGRLPLALASRTVILVDDGLATGYTMLAAIRSVRRHRAARVVVAVPVAPPETVERIRAEADEIVCVRTPRLFAVGEFYRDFSQTSDAEVSAALALHT